MEKPLISIIVPVYNVESYLAECIDSLVNQTYPHLEILLVDDGSTDGSGQICDDYAQKDARIKVIHKKNGGNTSARKAGLRVATGAYVQFVDSDDWVEPDMCESLMALAQEHGADVVRCGCWKESGEKSVRQCDAMPKGVYRTEEEQRFLRDNLIFLQDNGEAALFGSLCIQLTTSDLLKRVLMKEPDEVQYAEDRACVFLTILHSRCVCFTEGCFYHYRQHAGSIMHSANRRYYAQINAWYLFLYEEVGIFAEAETLRKQLLAFTDRMILYGLNRKIVANCPVVVPVFYFRMDQIPVGSRIVLYGAGEVGRSYQQLIRLTACYNIVVWVDQNDQACRACGDLVRPVEDLRCCEFDYIVVAVLNEKTYQTIRTDLCKRFGLAENTIVWLRPVRAERMR